MILGLVITVQAATVLIVGRYNRGQAISESLQRLDIGAAVFEQRVHARIDELARSSALLAGDYAFRQVFATGDRPTLNSVLENHRHRIGADLMILLDPAGDVIAETRHLDRDVLLTIYEEADEAEDYHADAWVVADGHLYALVMVPLFAPPPVVVAWIATGFEVTDYFVQDLGAATRLGVSFMIMRDDAAPSYLATSLSTELAAEIAGRVRGEGSWIIQIKRDRLAATARSLSTLGPTTAFVMLTRSMSEELAAARALEIFLFAIGLAGLAVAAIAAAGIARGVSKPVQQLAEAAGRIGQGDTSVRTDLPHRDEIGALGKAFNRMAEGLAERDRVRDLLGKVVSPEIAGKLLRDGVELGGEEREVTVLFSDLQGFTPLSERLSPPELVALLNRYLDRMCAVIERHGGVVDKFIGDAIMALFGAPISDPNSADRALAAAREMADELKELNRELAEEGIPPLGFGVGINTGVVVAGNMGSARRLNYTVIGDAVNVASRLEGLTRRPEFGGPILITAATLAALRNPPRRVDCGETNVKGRGQPLRVYRVEIDG